MTNSKKCYYHTDVETRLQCVECGKFICPKCAINAPVGYKCKDCSKPKEEFKKEKINSKYAYTIALIAGSLLGILINAVKPFGFLIYWASCYLLGFAIARIITYFIGYSYNPKKVATSGIIVFLSIGLNPLNILIIASSDIINNLIPAIILLASYNFDSILNIIGIGIATWAGIRHIKF